ncbi:MAG: DUF1080 domain-containing protein [Planctomycetaceae bacterium]
MRYTVVIWSLVSTISIAAASTSWGNDPATVTPSPTKPEAIKSTEWQSLFDGKTLTNWKATEYGGEGDVLVKEGQIIVEAGEPLSGVTWTGGELPKSNYEVRLEAQKIEGSDFFLALTFPVKESHCSLVLGGWGGGVTGLSSIDGFDASENETTDYQDYPVGKWFPVRVRVTDDSIQAWLDGERIVNVDTQDKRISIRIEVDQNCPLGMTTFQTKAGYRKIEARKLGPDDLKAADSKPSL